MLSESQTKQLLICQNQGCDEQFVDDVNKELEGDAASLPAALKAHKSGWKIVEGKIFCPRCANEKSNPN